MNNPLRNAAAAALLISLASAGHAEGAISFSRDITIDRAPATVWKYVGDFNATDLWHPSVRNSTLKGNGTKPGAIRTLTLISDGEMVEKLLAYDAAKTRYTYTTLKSPFPIKNCVSTLSVSPTADGKTLMTWSATFDAVDVDEDIATEWLGIAIDGGLGKVATHFEKAP
ncbi:SRPBCC family protein [Methylibium petroleiphilum]|uniref:SRPBCC family protein n=1 Tax=Methylibium petroleiphilum TaxID=105560 RepID=UPI003D2BF7F3